MKQVIAAGALGSALALSACGGKQAASSPQRPPTTTVAVAQVPTSTTTTPTTTAAPKRRSPKPAAAGGAKTGGGSSSRSAASRGGDASLQTFGSSASGPDRAAVTDVVRRYLAAAAGADHAGQCALLAPEVTRQLQAIASHAPPLKGKPCSTLLAAIESRSLPSWLANAYRHPSFVGVRVDRGAAIAFLRLPRQGRSFLALSKAGDGWKVRSLAPAPMP